jgi:hypothetical protein
MVDLSCFCVFCVLDFGFVFGYVFDLLLMEIFMPKDPNVCMREGWP